MYRCMASLRRSAFTRPRVLLAQATRAASSSQASHLACAGAGATALALSLWKNSSSPAVAEPLSLEDEVAKLERLVDMDQRVADLERKLDSWDVAAAVGKHAAFVFIKPHAVNDNVKALVTKKLKDSGIHVVSEGAIKAEEIDKKQLIDTHYGAIAAKAVKLTPDKLTVQPKAQDAFEKTFGLKWADAVASGKVYNAMDGAKKMGISPSELDGEWSKLKVGETLLKFGGGFYCGKVGDIFVINGFYMAMRGKFTTPGTSIYYYQVEWDPKELSWADFREKVLGGTNPAKAHETSARRMIYDTWQSLGLDAVPNTGDNGVHASASPFEALSERCNWLGASIDQDFYGKGMLAAGVPLAMVRAWCDDPQVSCEGKKQSIFDLLEDKDAGDCLAKSGSIARENVE